MKRLILALLLLAPCPGCASCRWEPAGEPTPADEAFEREHERIMEECYGDDYIDDCWW